MDNFQDELDSLAKDYNSRGIPEFEGYSPNEMSSFVYHPFGESGVVSINKLSKSEYAQIPLLNQVKYLMTRICDDGFATLTKTGALPTKLVKNIYEQGFIKDEMAELGLSKIHNEGSCMHINLTRLLLEIAGLVKKRSGKLSLTKKGETLLNQDEELFREIFEIFAFKFNWAYYDGYKSEQLGQLGLGFSLMLLSKYGAAQRLDYFYGEKYLTAFPMLVDEMGAPKYMTPKEIGLLCYSTRLFDRFLDYFGVIEIEKERLVGEIKNTIKTKALFNKLISVRPPKTS